jgi:hypothetical protein
MKRSNALASKISGFKSLIFLWGHFKQLVYSQPINSTKKLTEQVVAASAQIREDREIFFKGPCINVAEGTCVYHASRTTLSAFTVNKLR